MAAQEKTAEDIHIDIPGESEPSKRSFSRVLHDALDENAQELAELKAEPIPEASEIDVAVGKSRFWSKNSYFVVGVLCVVLAMIGVVTCAVKGVGMVRKFATSGSLRSELEAALYPVAVADLPAFEDTEHLDSRSMMAAGMMDLIMYSDLSVYPRTFDMLSIPAKDVADHAGKLFGVENLEPYMSIQAAGENFYYDASSGCYTVPASPVIFSYSPEIRKIKHSGDGVYVVTAEYSRDRANWQERSENQFDNSRKTMEVTVQKSSSGCQILKIVNISEQGME